jgi:hypothetical protein
MTASVRRRSSFSRALLALGGVALLALLALAALLIGGALTEQTRVPHVEAHGAAAAVVGERDHAAPEIHAIRQQPSTHARTAAFAVLAAMAVVAAWAFSRLRFARGGRLRTVRIAGLPPGRAPPALRIA